MIVLVLRSGGDYDAEYVDRLVAAMPTHRVVCLSDCAVPCERIPLEYGWPGWWAKMELYRPDLAGDVLYMDLDTVVQGPLDDFLAVGRLTMLRDFYREWGLGSGLMFLPEADRAEVWRAWIASPGHWMAEYQSGGDQAFLERLWLKRSARWQDLLPGRVASYKAAGKAEREQAAVVCFHGSPRPREVQWRV